MSHTGELLLVLMVAVSALTVLARTLGIPYPIVLVVGGLALGAIPGVPEVELDPDLVLGLFLPPLLYAAAFFASLRDLRAELRPISLLAVGLVTVTMCVVAVVAHALIDGLPWAAAFALGAIVAPTDPLAATSIARRLGAPRRFVTIVEGESLINDGTALVLYRAAVVAAVGGSFSLWEAGLRFVGSAAGGIAIGLAVGWMVTEVRRRIDDAPVEITISLATPYAAYLPAEELGVSGVLAAVTTGIYLGWKAPEISTASMRMQGFAVWDLLQFLLNALLFVLIGLQLPNITDGIGGYSTLTVIALGAAMWATVVGTRILWQFTVPYLVRAVDRRASQRARRAPWRIRVLLAWAGMRGAVSLAAALALPLETDAGDPFPQRELIVFLVFCVILGTLVVQGLTLAPAMRALGIEGDDLEEREELAARLAAADAALERLDELAGEEWTRDDTVERLRGAYRYRRNRFAARREGGDVDGYEERSFAYQRLVRELLVAQRAAIVTLRNRGEISNDVMHRIERELDLEDSRLEL